MQSKSCSKSTPSFIKGVGQPMRNHAKSKPDLILTNIQRMMSKPARTRCKKSCQKYFKL